MTSELNTRAVPDVPELVRYRFEVSSEGHPFMVICDDGEYIFHADAAAMIERLQIDASKHAHDAETVRRERDALITKLDQNKAQKPVGIFTKSDISQYIQLRSGDATTNPIPLYAAPVDQTAEIESITSYAKQIIAAFDEDNDLDNPEKFNAYHNLKSAISGKEPE